MVCISLYPTVCQTTQPNKEVTLMLATTPGTPCALESNCIAPSACSREGKHDSCFFFPPGIALISLSR